jgi:hypothetical protein
VYHNSKILNVAYNQNVSRVQIYFWIKILKINVLCSDGKESFIAHHLDKRSHDDNFTSKMGAIQLYFISVLRQATKRNEEEKKKNKHQATTSLYTIQYFRNDKSYKKKIFNSWLMLLLLFFPLYSSGNAMHKRDFLGTYIKYSI